MEATVLAVCGGKFDWNVRVVRAGDVYGRAFDIVHQHADPLVEFYDTRFSHTTLGQFVSRHYLSTILKGEGRLCLDGGIAEWVVTDEAMAKVRGWLSRFPEAAACRPEPKLRAG